MSKIDAKKLYLQIKAGNSIYEEEIHCPMVLHVMNTKGTMTAFCKEALISDSAFYRWIKKYPLFNDCYQLGRMFSKSNWEEEGESGKDDENFNLDYWRITGACRYGVGKARVRLAIDADSNPYEQYKQLVEQAACEEFSAAELKQLMESINVGLRAWEGFELQGQLNEMKSDLVRMDRNNVNYTGPIEKFEKTD